MHTSPLIHSSMVFLFCCHSLRLVIASETGDLPLAVFTRTIQLAW